MPGRPHAVAAGAEVAAVARQAEAACLELVRPLVREEVALIGHAVVAYHAGDAVYVGPTLYVQLSRKTFMTAAWNTQVAGRDLENPGALNLSEFSRHRAKLKVAVEF